MVDSAASGKTWEFIQHATLTVHYGYSLAVESASVVHSLLSCIVGLFSTLKFGILQFKPCFKIVPDEIE